MQSAFVREDYPFARLYVIRPSPVPFLSRERKYNGLKKVIFPFSGSLDAEIAQFFSPPPKFASARASFPRLVCYPPRPKKPLGEHGPSLIVR